MPRAPRARPEGCCPLRAISPLPERERERWLGLFRALADPTRLEILRLVASQPGPTCVCDLVAHFDLAQPTISHHLKVLREAGLLTATRLGIWSYYALDARGAALLEDAASLTDTGARPAPAAPRRAARRRA
jgi:ArsR family transcriptional regulator, arsenate/arsenite/antimonite-responsive transcriptional repressor